MKKIIINALLFASASIFSVSAFPQALPAAPAVSRVGSALASGITKNLMIRGFAMNDPRIFTTIEAVGARVIPLASAAGTGANWIATVGRLSPWIVGGITVYQGIKWYVDNNGNITVNKDSSNAQIQGNGVTAGGICYHVMDSDLCASSPEEALITYVLMTTVFIDATEINLVPISTESTYYANGRRYHATMSGHRSDLDGIFSNFNAYQIYIGTSPVKCLPGYVANGTQCISGQLIKYHPSVNPQNAPVSPQQAFDNLPQTAKDADLSPELASDIANRLWRQASLQPEYRGVPWSADAPVVPQNFPVPLVEPLPSPAPLPAPQPAVPPVVSPVVSPVESPVVSPIPWPKTSELAEPVPSTSPITSPTSNPNQISPSSSAQKVDLGADPGTPAPTLEDTPTDLFKPISDLLSPWLSWQVPAHSSQCPTWQGSPSIAGYVFNLDLSYHCVAFNEHREVIYRVSLAVWAIISIFIVLSA